jgi:hypothetical protein
VSSIVKIFAMPYGTIAFFVSVALAVWFVLVSEASIISKIIVAGVFGFGIACYLNWIAGWGRIGLFVLIGLGIGISFYRAVQESGWRR